MSKDYGSISYENYQKTLADFRSRFGGGRILCQHHWGKPSDPDLPSGGFRATVTYPNGVIATRYHYFDRILQCGKCGRVKGENDGWM